ncbi:MAG: hypothetical protein LKG19_10470 [Saprospiraceae bacterium]|nr:hypothetical protein [Saprospiraceae bacterium]
MHSFKCLDLASVLLWSSRNTIGTHWIWCFVNGIITDKDIKSFDNKRRRTRRGSFKCLDVTSVFLWSARNTIGTKWIWCFVNGIITYKNIKSFGNMSGEIRSRLFTNVLM